MKDSNWILKPFISVNKSDVMVEKKIKCFNMNWIMNTKASVILPTKYISHQGRSI